MLVYLYPCFESLRRQSTSEKVTRLQLCCLVGVVSKERRGPQPITWWRREEHPAIKFVPPTSPDLWQQSGEYQPTHARMVIYY